MNHTHNWKKVNETNEGILEICIECKKRLSTKKDPQTGRIDNRKYAKEHSRDIAQPFGRTSKIFKKYYGEAKDVRYK